jgi:hypothetical protein
MANRVRTGMHPLRMLDGSQYDIGGATPCLIPSSNANNLFVGQAVIRTGSANSTEIGQTGPVLGASGMTIGSLPTVATVTAGDGNRITGVIVGVGADADDNGRAPYRKASTTSVVFVEMNPKVVYEMATTSAASTFTVDDIGLNGNIAASGAATGSTVTGFSDCILDNTLAADASNQLRVIGLSRDPQKNDLASANVSFEVVLNNVTEDTIDVLGV